MSHRVRFRNHGQSPASCHGQLKPKPQNPFHASTSMHGRLHRRLVRRAGRQRSAVVRVFTFGVFPHHDQVDRLLAAQRPRHAAKRLGRPDIRVKIKRLTQLHDGQKPNAVRQSRRPAERAQKNRVKPAERVQKILRRHPPVTLVVAYPPVKSRAVEPKLANDSLRGLDRHHRGIHDLGPDSITRIQGNSIGFQRRASRSFFRGRVWLNAEPSLGAGALAKRSP